jgi:hypothetical protein
MNRSGLNQVAWSYGGIKSGTEKLVDHQPVASSSSFRAGSRQQNVDAQDLFDVGAAG